MKVDLYSEKGAKLATKVELPREIFGIKPNEAALRQYIHVYQTNQRRGTVKAKTRGEVSGGGRKPWRQKGTGRARHGSIRSPIWVGGGVAHGPRPRSFALSIPKKIARLALKSALSFKVSEKRIRVLQRLGFEEPKTAVAAKLLERLGTGKRVLVVVPERDENLHRSFRNLEKVEVRTARELNAYDTVLADDLILLKEAVARLKERLVSEPGSRVARESDRKVGQGADEKRATGPKGTEAMAAKTAKSVKTVKSVRASSPRQARGREPSSPSDTTSGSKIKEAKDTKRAATKAKGAKVKTVKSVKAVKKTRKLRAGKKRTVGGSAKKRG